jgi:23S rRNA pseudouridine1911/1915/1917 synthase
MSASSFRATIPPEFDGKRLDKVVVELLGGAYSRSRLAGWIREGRLQVDGKILHKPGVLVEEGQQLLLTPPSLEVPEPGSALEPIVLYRDECLAVLDKPAGLPMHGNSVGDPQMSVATWLAQEFGPDLPIGQGAERPGIVHRLDRGTSGVCVVAFERKVFEDLQSQFAERTIEKEYHAVCYGAPRFRSDWIERRLQADPKHPNRVVGTNSHGGGTRDALTYWEVLEQFDGFALLKVLPKTGRKHQIRVHLCSIGLPIVGDPFYHARNYGPGMLPESCPEVERTLLHAFGISFEHPVEGGRMLFRSDYPTLMQTVVDTLRTRRPARRGT